jgi:hypothetical protein
MFWELTPFTGGLVERGFKLLLWAIVAIFALMLLAPAPDIDTTALSEFTSEASEHAMASHEGAQGLVDLCNTNPGAILQNPDTRRTACIVFDPDAGSWGVGVFDDASGRNVTAFYKEKLKSFDEVLRYLGNRGYK